MSRQIATPARLEAFSDGVIAVIITIMVLELKVPHENGVAGLRAVLPTLSLYLISFAFVGIYWINHHHLIHRTEEADERILYANLGFLFCLSLLPFFTSYVLEKKMDSFSVAIYVASMILTGFSFLLLRLAIEQACEDGCRYYYMGDSGRSASLGKFKERFGARPYDYAEYRLERLPLTAAEEGLKRAVKRVIRFKDS